MNDNEMRWICDECGEPIPNNEGGIHAYNLKPTHGRPIGGLPSKPSPTEAVGMKPGEPWCGSFYDLLRLDFETNKTVGIQVLHTRCDGIRETGYWIAVDRAETAEEWIEWLAHISGKVWCGQMEFMELTRMWRGKRRAVAAATS